VRFLVSVALTYKPRPDVFTDRRPGLAVRTRRRCIEIAISTHAGSDRLLRTYRPKCASAPGNRASLMTSLTVTGHDGPATEEMPSLALGNTAFDPKRRDLRALSGDLPGRSLADLRSADRLPWFPPRCARVDTRTLAVCAYCSTSSGWSSVVSCSRSATQSRR
jgi:hypothetical protein